MVRRAAALARVGPHRCSPVRTESPLRENLRLISDRALLASLHRRRLCARKGEQTTVPFALLAILLVLVIVALLLAVYFVVRRWL
jgi:hypothetical protein